MGNKNKIIDTYIAKSAEFAKPILVHIRKLVHEACPKVEETIKWGFPHFDYKGEMMCSMAAFKQHCAFGFWKGSLINGLGKKGESAMGQVGQIKSIKDLPSDKKIMAFIKEAMRLNDEGIKVAAKEKSTEKKELIIPKYFLTVLNKNEKALKVFENFSYSHKKEYVEWIIEAKTEETKNKRMATAIEWMTEGKDRNWKYRR